jgi:hypothetical protein
MGDLSFRVFTFPAELVAQTIKFVRGGLCGVIVESQRVVGKKLLERRLGCMSAVLPPATFLGNIGIR